MIAYVLFWLLKWFTVRVVCASCGTVRMRRFKLGGGLDSHTHCVDCAYKDFPGFAEWREKRKARQ